MIIRRRAASYQLITQPAHAALAERIMLDWDSKHFPESPRKASILHAIREHDSGWAELDDQPAFDPATGQLFDFIELPTELKLRASQQGIDLLAADPYAAALVAQHRLHVYRRYAEHPDWLAFFAAAAAARDSYLRDAGVSLDLMLRDYKLLRAGDLASLGFCTEDANVKPEECGYAMRLEGTTLIVTPDPFGGRTIAIEVAARELSDRTFGSPADARRAVADAPVIALQGFVRGAAE